MAGRTNKWKFGWYVLVVLAATLAGYFLMRGGQAGALALPPPSAPLSVPVGGSGTGSAGIGGYPQVASPTPTPPCSLAWREVDSPNPNSTNRNDLADLAAVSANDVWAVGESANDTAPYLAPSPLLEHWDGSNWSISSVNIPQISDTHLSGVAAASSTDVWAVGDADTVSGHQTLLLHWDGSVWSRVPAPNIVVPVGGVRDVGVVSSNDVWVVGSYLQGVQTQALALHWDGSIWIQATTPSLIVRNSLQGVTVVSSNDVWAVGELNANAPAFMHWDGSNWTLFDNTAVVSGALLRVSAVSANDIWAVGYFTNGRRLPLTMHYDGTSWSVVDTPLPCCNQELTDVQAISSNDVWAISETDFLHWDGTVWSLVGGPNPPQSTSYFLEGLGKVSSNDVWAVGHAHISGGGNSFDSTLTEHFSGDCPGPTFTSTSTDTPNPIFTETPTYTPTHATTGTPTASPTDYVVAPSTGTVVPGTTDVGNHCDDCVNSVPLPFPATLYDRQFTAAIAGSNGTLGFVSNPNAFANGCVPDGATNFAIFPYWDNLDTDNSSCPTCGIFTSVSGSAPTRIFNIEWRAKRVGGGSTVLDFEVRLYEGQGNFDLVYGQVDPAATESIGVQRDTGSLFTSVACLLSGAPDRPQQSQPLGWIIADGVQLSFGGPYSTPTPTSTVTPTSTPTCSISFTDVPPGSTFYPFIHCLACLGLVNGYSDGTFKPNNDVTRGQLSKIVANAAGFNDTPSGQQFQDVPPTGPGSTFYVYIYRLASRGYISGYPCGGTGEPCVPPDNFPYFRPNANSTRGQISKIVSNAAGFSETPSGQQFQDVTPSNAFYAYIYRLVQHNVMGGYPCGPPPAGQCLPPNYLPYFLPSNNATRGQTSKIVSNTFFPDCNIGVRSTK